MSKNNTARKSPLTPTVGMILVIRSEVLSKKTGPAKVLSVDHEKGNVTVYRPGGRTPHTVIDFDSLRRYRATTPSEFPGVDFDETMGAARSTLTDKPSSPKANDEESRSEPPPPPAANDTAITVSAQFIEAQREANKRMDKLESMVTSLVALVAGNLQNKAASAPTKTKEQEREEATNKQVNEEMPWARPQLERFIEETMEFVTFATQAEIDRALRPGEVFDQFSLWCDVNNLRVPFQKTVYRALLDNPRTRLRCKLSGTDERTPLAVRRQTRLGFDESQPIGKDVRAIVDHARRAAWPDLKEAHRETIANLLMAKVSKADILVALDYIAAKPGRGKDSYTPDKVLTVKHIGSLVRLARAESDQ
jgi:hypothetical protein